jgi:penicillin-binding protein 1A
MRVPKLKFDPRFRKFRRWLFISVGSLSAAFVLMFIIIGSTLPDFEVLENTTTDLSTVVYSRDGQILGQYYAGENRINVQLHEIPQNLKDALIATEDIRFFGHSGVDLVGQFRAVSSLLSGGGMQGGSTITMQLARNLYDEQVGKSRSVDRKIKEMVAAVFLERSYTKDEIMMHYLNTVPFLGDKFGVQSASQYLFRKNSRELHLHESALLVGLLKGGSYYNPHRHPERALNRRNTVLEQMEKYGFLTEREADSVKKLPLGVVAPTLFTHNEGLAPYFREELRKWMKDWCDNNGYNLYTDGLRVYTTIDTRLQRYAEAAVRKHLAAHQKNYDAELKQLQRAPWDADTNIIRRAMRQSARFNMSVTRYREQGKTDAEARRMAEREFHEAIPMQVFSWDAPNNILDTVLTPWDSLRYYARFLNTGFVAMEPGTGHVLAWVGGPDYRFFKYDHIQQSRRQVGSTFKPFVYTAAFDNGYSPCYQISNQPFIYETEDGKRWTPKNADGKYSGCMTLRSALANSVNIPTARLMRVVGPRVVSEYAYKMGIKSTLEMVPSLSLGTADLTVMELVAAYNTYANMGRYIEPTFVTRIEDRNGNVVATFVPNSRRALSHETSYLMIDILRAVINGGTGASLRYSYGLPGNLDMAGKTGTTNSHADGWFVGFTTRIVAGAWVGHDDRNIHFYNMAHGQGAAMALPIWGYFMSDAYKDAELALRPSSFDAPEELRVETDCLLFSRRAGQRGCGEEEGTYVPPDQQ